MIKIKRLSECIGKKVFTDGGDFFGFVEGVNISENKVDGWKIVSSRDSSFYSLLGGARGIVVPHQFVRAIGDVFIISKTAVPVGGVSNFEEEMALDEEVM